MDDDGERDGAKPVLMDPGAVAGRLGWDTVATICQEETDGKKERKNERTTSSDYNWFNSLKAD